MTYRFKILLLAFYCLSYIHTATAQHKKTADLPQVFQMGEHPEGYERLFIEHETPLFTVCNEDFDSTFRVWFDMVLAMQNFAEENNYDINSIKLAISVFWEPDGSIRHLAYTLMADSKHIQTDMLTAFLSVFCHDYVLPTKHTHRFFHDGQVGWPVITR